VAKEARDVRITHNLDLDAAGGRNVTTRRMEVDSFFGAAVGTVEHV
jgi:hypothetical protein